MVYLDCIFENILMLNQISVFIIAIASIIYMLTVSELETVYKLMEVKMCILC